MDRAQLDRIIGAVPNFRSRWYSFLSEWKSEEEPPWYIGMNKLAHYVIDCQSQGSISELPILFATIEDILQNPDYDIESLVAIGLFEDMQSIATHREFGAAPFRHWLGTRSLALWDEVDAGVKRVADWQKEQKPKWWQFWRRREGIDVEKTLSQVQSPELRKILESEYRRKR